LFYPLPCAAYLPTLAFMKKAIAMPPKTAPAIADAPSIPSAAKYGVPEPVDGFYAAASTLAFASFSVSSSVLAPVSPPSPTLPIYWANAGAIAPVAISVANRVPNNTNLFISFPCWRSACSWYLTFFSCTVFEFLCLF